MQICDGAVCWPSLIHRLSSEWELVTETVSPKDISQEGLPVKVQTLLGRHAHTLVILWAAAGHLPIHVHPGIHTNTENSVPV